MSDTHLAVALIIVFEGTIITGKVVPGRLFEMSETMRSDKDKFSTHAGVPHSCASPGKSTGASSPRRQKRTFCAAYLPPRFCLKRGRDTLKHCDDEKDGEKQRKKTIVFPLFHHRSLVWQPC